jgi:hypothetical protein
MKLKLITLIKNMREWRWMLIPVLVLLFSSTGMAQTTNAAGKKRVVQLSGFVTVGDSLFGVGGVGIYVPGTDRGVQSNQYGFFSLPVLAGDSVVFSALGFKKQHLIIPKTYKNDSYSIILQMQEQPIELAEVKVIPWATERAFKEAILAVKLPDNKREEAMRNLDPKLLEELIKSTPMDGSGNFKTWNMQQVRQTEQRGMIPTVSPFAILQLLNMIRNGDFKNK